MECQQNAARLEKLASANPRRNRSAPRLNAAALGRGPTAPPLLAQFIRQFAQAPGDISRLAQLNPNYAPNQLSPGLKPSAGPAPGRSPAINPAASPLLGLHAQPGSVSVGACCDASTSSVTPPHHHRTGSQGSVTVFAPDGGASAPLPAFKRTVRSRSFPAPPRPPSLNPP